MEVALSFTLAHNPGLLKEVLGQRGTEHLAEEPKLDREVLAKSTGVVVDDHVRVAKGLEQRVHLSSEQATRHRRQNMMTRAKRCTRNTITMESKRIASRGQEVAVVGCYIWLGSCGVGLDMHLNNLLLEGTLSFAHGQKMANQELGRFRLSRATLTRDDDALVLVAQHQRLVCLLRHTKDVWYPIQISIVEVLERHGLTAHGR